MKTEECSQPDKATTPCSYHSRKWGLMFPLIGLLSLIWVVIRIVPKPARATYPCQKVAMPLAFSFVAWVGGLCASIFAAKHVHRFARQSRWVLAAGCMVAGVFFAYVALESGSHEPLLANNLSPAFVPELAHNTPLGEAKGINPGRVTWAYDPQAATWDGETGFYWEDANLSMERVEAMLSESLRSLTGQETDAAAWNALFTHFNTTRGRREGGYEKGEKIVIKLNMNVGDKPENRVHNSPQMVLALARQLVNNLGVEQGDITFTDASRVIGDHMIAYCHNEFPEIRFSDREGRGVRVKAEPDLEVTLHHADPDVVDSGVTFLPLCTTQAAYMINLALLKGHDLAGVTLGAKNHYGSVWREREKDSWNKGWAPANLHETIAVTGRLNLAMRPMGTYNPMVELLGHEHLDGKGVLFLVESYYAAIAQSGVPVRWQSEPFDGGWPSSLFISQDPVALESVVVDFVRVEPGMTHNSRGPITNYLVEAALAHDPPSGAVYDPEGDGVRLQSLGAHEHWNNERDRQYSRNLGTGNGIELVQIRKDQ